MSEETKTISLSTFNQFKEIGQENLQLRKELNKSHDLLTHYKIYFELLSYCVMALTGAFGLNTPDGKMIRESIITNDPDLKEDPTRSILKQIVDLGAQATLQELPGERGRAAKEAMNKRFAFLAYLPVVVQFYKAQKDIPLKAIPPQFLEFLPKEVIEELEKASNGK